MNERNAGSFSADSGLVVYEAYVSLPQLVERSLDIVDPQGDVMQTGPALPEKFRDRRIRRRRLQQLQRRGARCEKLRAYALGRDIFRRLHLEAQAVAKECQGRFQIGDSDTDVV